jgi:thiosulfate reductase / polysulfide reductase chain A
MTVSRREFIKIGGASAGGVAAVSGLTSNLWGLDPDVVHDPKTDGERIVPTFCELCFWKCGVLAHVKGGRVTKITGNPAHPLSRGRLCPRGTGGMGLAHDPDRLTHPLIRSEERGEQVFRQVSWEAALDETAERLVALKEKHGPEALALYSHGYGASWFKTLLKAYGTGNFAAPSFAQCRGAREVAFQLTYGSPVGSPEPTDIRNARVLTLIGSHLGENMHNTQVQELAAAIDAGAQLVVVDPRHSVAAGKARYWLPIKPGTDIALLLAWMHVIVGEGLYDRDYIEQHATGLEELKLHLADKTPQWAWTRTGIEPELIAETARFIAGASPASLVHPGRRASWYGDDTQRGRAVAILNALLGTWGRKGGFYLPTAMSIPKVPHPPYAHSPKPSPDSDAHTVYPFANKVLSHGICNASIPGNAATYDIKSWLVYGTNLIQAMPQPDETVAALRALESVIVIDVLPAEITGWADIVLPEASYLERYDDLHTPAFREGYVALRQPVVDPPGEAKPGWWIAKELGNRLGVGDFFDWEHPRDYLKMRLDKAGIELAELERTGVIEAPSEPIYYDEGLEPVFDTPSGKIELYSQQMADAGLDPLPQYTPHEEPPAGSYRLLFGRAPTHTFGRTTNNRFLGEVMSENEVWLNAQVAVELGLKDGEMVDLVNQDDVRVGPARLKATQRLRSDCVYVVHGFGHTAPKLTFAKGRGINDSALLTRTKIDPVMGGTGMNVNFVRVERTVSA